MWINCASEWMYTMDVNNVRIFIFSEYNFHTNIHTPSLVFEHVYTGRWYINWGASRNENVFIKSKISHDRWSSAAPFYGQDKHDILNNK